MTFLEWCLLDTEDDNPMNVHVGRKVYKAGESVSGKIVEWLKQLTLSREPVLKNGVWEVYLK